jgi:hypothetical protein
MSKICPILIYCRHKTNWCKYGVFPHANCNYYNNREEMLEKEAEEAFLDRILDDVISDVNRNEYK